MSSSWPFPQESHFLNEVFIIMTTTHFSVAQHLSISPCFEDPMCPFHRVLGALIILEPTPHGGSFTHQALALLTSLAVQVQTQVLPSALTLNDAKTSGNPWQWWWLQPHCILGMVLEAASRVQLGSTEAASSIRAVPSRPTHSANRGDIGPGDPPVSLMSQSPSAFWQVHLQNFNIVSLCLTQPDSVSLAFSELF